MIKQDGGYAHYWKEEDGQGGYIDHPGMTLRDYFAASALTGLWSCVKGLSPGDTSRARMYLVEEAYASADAMLAAMDK